MALSAVVDAHSHQVPSVATAFSRTFCTVPVLYGRRSDVDNCRPGVKKIHRQPQHAIFDDECVAQNAPHILFVEQRSLLQP